MLARVARLPHVSSVTSPYGQGGQISRDGTIGLATVNLDAQADTVPSSAVTKLISTAQSADSSLLNVQLGGAAIETVVTPNADYTSVLLGIVLALIVLFFAFRRSVYGGAPAADLGAGGDRSRHLDRQRPHARRLDRELGAHGRRHRGARRGRGLRAVRRQPAPQRAARRADARGRRRHRAQHLRPRRAAGRADRMRRAAGAARPAGPLPARGGRDNLARGRPDHGGVADPAAGHAGLPGPEGAAASRAHKARPGRAPGRADRSLLAALGRRARPQAADPRPSSRWR